MVVNRSTVLHEALPGLVNTTVDVSGDIAAAVVGAVEIDEKTSPACTLGMPPPPQPHQPARLGSACMHMVTVFVSATMRPDAALISTAAVTTFVKLGWGHDVILASSECGMAKSTSRRIFLVCPPVVATRMKSCIAALPSGQTPPSPSPRRVCGTPGQFTQP